MHRAESDGDVKVFKKFFNDGNASRIFVDVGAARPDYLSISALFREKNWRVVAIEPNPEFAQMHRELGHEVYEYACGTENSDEVEFCVADSHAAPYEGGKVSYESFSSISLKPGYKALMPNTVTLKQIKIRVRRLDSVLREAGVASIDILSADVEGWELEVLEGLDLSKYKPSVIILENLLRDNSYVKKLAQYGYMLWQEFPPNQVFIRPELVRNLSLIERLSRWVVGR